MKNQNNSKVILSGNQKIESRTVEYKVIRHWDNGKYIHDEVTVTFGPIWKPNPVSGLPFKTN
jgi:hypothetical protein